jgi:SAM-dependent methyltransferase
MPRTEPFEGHTERYESWFERNPLAYESEVLALRQMLPPGRGLEVGVGSGRFAAPLGIARGVEPSERMRLLARQRGVDAIDGVAERLPFPEESFDVVLMVTTICFVDDLPGSLNEANRVLRARGHLVIGFIDRESLLGREYEAHRAANVFYREATFFSAREVSDRVRQARFGHLRFRQTIFTPLDEIAAIQPSRPGHGAGAFVVVRAERDA